MSDPYAKYANFEGPTPDEQWRGYARTQGRSVGDSCQGGGGLLQMSPRLSKYNHQQIGNIRVK